MSRTYKTMPYLVKLRKGYLTTVEDHDHRDGVCDIDGRYGNAGRGHCTHRFHFDGVYPCCCRLCHGPPWGWGGRLHPRAEKRKALGGWRDEY